jgi:hypothetical protein
VKIGKQEVQTRIVVLYAYCLIVTVLLNMWFVYLGLFLDWSLGQFIVVQILPVLFISYYVIAHAIAEQAEKKNRNYKSFLGLSLLVSPILMGIIVAVMTKPDKK